jgi:hypothetical protein
VVHRYVARSMLALLRVSRADFRFAKKLGCAAPALATRSTSLAIVCSRGLEPAHNPKGGALRIDLAAVAGYIEPARCHLLGDSGPHPPSPGSLPRNALFPHRKGRLPSATSPQSPWCQSPAGNTSVRSACLVQTVGRKALFPCVFALACFILAARFLLLPSGCPAKVPGWSFYPSKFRFDLKPPPGLPLGMGWFGRKSRSEELLQQAIDKLFERQEKNEERTLRLLEAVEKRVSTTEGEGSLSQAFAEALKGFAGAFGSVFESNAKMHENLLNRASKDALAARLQASGSEGGKASGKAKKQRVAEQAAGISVDAVRASCEECRSRIDGDRPKHANDMMKHAAEKHDSSYLDQLLSAIRNGNKEAVA